MWVPQSSSASWRGPKRLSPSAKVVTMVPMAPAFLYLAFLRGARIVRLSCRHLARISLVISSRLAVVCFRTFAVIIDGHPLNVYLV